MFTIIVNGVEAQFCKRAVEALPGKVITCEAKVTTRYLNVMHKILLGQRLTPGVDLMSHECVYNSILMMRSIGLTDEAIERGFAGWSSSKKWIELWDPKYIYILMLELESIVDVRKYIRRYKGNPFSIVRELINMPELRSRGPAACIQMLIFFKQYNITTCFKKNNDIIQARIETLGKYRDEIWESFLICPHDAFWNEYLQYTPPTEDTWSCDGITQLAKYSPGDAVIVDIETAKERVRTFTLGMLDIAPNKRVVKPFPFENVAFAGGAVTKLLGANFDSKKARQSDVDLFIFGPDFATRSQIFEEVIEWFKTYNNGTATTYYALQGSVTTVYIKDRDRKFQIISMKARNPYEVMHRFDFSHIQWCMHMRKFLGTPEAFMSIREQMTRFCNTNRLRTERMVKSLYCGYSIMKTVEIMRDHLDISVLFEPAGAERLQKYIRDLFKWWYPQSQPDMDPVDEMNHILSMIEMDAHATNVTADPLVVLNNITIDGNFDGGDYSSLSFTKFNIGAISNVFGNRRITRATVRTKSGAIRLTTSPYTCARVTNGAGSLDISVRVCDDFVKFIGELEGPVYRLFNAAAVNIHLCEDGIIKFSIPRYKLEGQVKHGYSIMRSQRGMPMNIEEELNAGDSIQVLFLIDVIRGDEGNKIELKPIKVIKFVRYEPGEHTCAQVDDRAEAEVDARIIAETTIQYDE